MTITWLGGLALIWLVMKFVRGYKKGFVKEAVSFIFLISSLILVWAINPYVTDFLKEKTPAYEKIQNLTEDMVDKAVESCRSMQGDAKENLINQLPLPKILKKKIMADDTKNMYQILEARNFKEYVSQYLAQILIKGLSFILSYLVIAIAFSIIGHSLNLFAKLPVINTVNKLVGGLLGTATGVLIIWIVLLLITLLYNTSAGKQLMNLIYNDVVLRTLYENDILIRLFMGIFRG